MRRRNPEARLAHGPTPGISRRQLLGGVAGSAALGLLVTLPAEDAFASQPTETAAPSDVLWLFGCVNGQAGYIGQAIGPSGQQIATLPGIPWATARTGDGTLVLTASAAKGQPTVVHVYDAGSGLLIRSISGASDWPAEPDLHLATDTTGGGVSVVGQYLTSSTTGNLHKRHRPHGGWEMVAETDWTAYRLVETFDVAKGLRIAGSDRARVPLGSSLDIVTASQTFSLVDHGPATTTLHSAPLHSPGGLTSHELANHANLLHTDSEGRSYPLTNTGRLVITAAGVVRPPVPLPIAALPLLTAKPFAPSIVSAGQDSVALVDTSRRYAAIIDAATGTVLVERTLSTAGSFGPSASRAGTGVASDPRRNRLYIADPSGNAGGIWVHDGKTLEIIDRWHSDVAFSLLWAAPNSGTVYAQSVDGPVAVHQADGTLVAFASSALVTTQAL